MAFFVPASCNHRVFEWGLTVNQNQRKGYIRKQLRKDTSSIYEKAHTFYNLLRNFGTGSLEERARGEVGGSWTLIGSNHPTAIFSQHILYPASVQIVTSIEMMVSIKKSIPGGRPGGTAPVAETGAVPAP